MPADPQSTPSPKRPDGALNRSRRQAWHAAWARLGTLLAPPVAPAPEPGVIPMAQASVQAQLRAQVARELASQPPVAVGQLRLLRARYCVASAQPLVLAVLGETEAGWRVAPCSPVGWPATPGELLVELADERLRVLAVEQALTVAPATLADSWLVTVLAAADLARAQALDAQLAESPAPAANPRWRVALATLPGRLGPPLGGARDARPAYLAEWPIVLADLRAGTARESTVLEVAESLAPYLIRPPASAILSMPALPVTLAAATGTRVLARYAGAAGLTLERGHSLGEDYLLVQRGGARALDLDGARVLTPEGRELARLQDGYAGFVWAGPLAILLPGGAYLHAAPVS